MVERRAVAPDREKYAVKRAKLKELIRSPKRLARTARGLRRCSCRRNRGMRAASRQRTVAPLPARSRGGTASRPLEVKSAGRQPREIPGSPRRAGEGAA